MRWRKLAGLDATPAGQSRARRMLCCGRRKENVRSVPDLTASPGRVPPAPPARLKDAGPLLIQSDFRKVSGISSEIFRQIEVVENDHDATTAAALEAVDRRGEMIVRILEVRQMGRSGAEAAKKFFALQDAKHSVQLVEIVKRPGQTLGLYIREGNGADRSDGVFISRIALESAVYNSGCLKVGDEILAVNLVDVRHMSLDDVVIIMSIPRRLLLATRQRKGKAGAASPSLPPRSEHKPLPPPVVVMKHDLHDDDGRGRDHRDHRDNRDHREHRDQRDHRNRDHLDGGRDDGERTRMGLGLSSYTPDRVSPLASLDLYSQDLYARPPSNNSNHWSYQPPPPVITEQPKSSAQHFVPYERGFPNTLESLAEKVHSFYPSSTTPRRLSTGGQATHSTRFGGARTMPRSGSDQHLPRSELADLAAPRHSLLRSSLKAPASASMLSRYGQQSRYGATPAAESRYGPTGTTEPRYGMTGTPESRFGMSGTTESRYGTTGSNETRYGNITELRYGTTGSTEPRYGSNGSAEPRYGETSFDTTGRYGTIGSSSKYGTSPGLPRRNRSLDYSSDTEASCPTRTPLANHYNYGYRNQPPSTLGGLTRATAGDVSNKFNSLPRDIRASTRLAMGKRLAERGLGALLSEPDVPAPVPVARGGRIPSSPSVFTSDEYRAWLSRAPSTGALYEQLRRAPAPRPRITTHYSAENIHDALKNLENSMFSSSYTLRGLSGRAGGGPARSLSTQHIALGSSNAGLGSPAARRVRQLLELDASPGSRHSAHSPLQHARHMDINPADFLKYKLDKPTLGVSASVSGLSTLALGSRCESGASGATSGMLWVHLLAGRGLRALPGDSGPATPTAPASSAGPATPASASYTRDLYAVLECDRVHKARTTVRTGEMSFDWDEAFELDLIEAHQLDILVYSWDARHRHRLCYRGAVALHELLGRANHHQLAVKLEPRGTMYIRLRHTDPATLYRRRPALGALGRAVQPLFGAELEAVVAREPRAAHAPPVPIIVRRCVDEIERRGLDIIGLYRLCGSATKKRILREAFERNARAVELSPEHVPDINVITGVLKDYLRELPQPLFTRCLYQMTLDALGVCLPDDPDGNAKLMISILECLPRASRATLSFLLEHLATVAALADRNKMTPHALATALAPPLMLQAAGAAALGGDGLHLDYAQPVAVLKYLLQIWPAPKHAAAPASVRRGEPAAPALGPRGSKASASPAEVSMHPQGHLPHSASPYRLPAAPSAACQPLALPARPDYGPSSVAHVLSSVKVGQYRPQSPHSALQPPAPPRSRQVIVSSPGSPSSSSDSQSGADTIKHGAVNGSTSSILRQPVATAQTGSGRNTPRRSPATAATAADAQPAIPGTSAGLAVTVNEPSRADSFDLAARAYSSTNPFLQNYSAADTIEEEDSWRSDPFATERYPSPHPPGTGTGTVS